MAATKSVKLWPWTESHRPKNLCTALANMMASSKFTLTERSLAIASGVTRADIVSWIEGRALPSEIELQGIASAFVLNFYGRVLALPKRQLTEELLLIRSTDERNI